MIKVVASSLWADDGHSILFALKSFDLDFRLNKPLGTIFSYGRRDWLKEFPILSIAFKKNQITTRTFERA